MLFLGWWFVLLLDDMVLYLFFFFQAEDGIRDRDVTGVQTCALPIFRGRDTSRTRPSRARDSRSPRTPAARSRRGRWSRSPAARAPARQPLATTAGRRPVQARRPRNPAGPRGPKPRAGRPPTASARRQAASEPAEGATLSARPHAQSP